MFASSSEGNTNFEINKFERITNLITVLEIIIIFLHIAATNFRKEIRLEY